MKTRDERTYPMAWVTAPGKVEFAEKKLAALSPKEVLIGVRACAICGSDLHIFRGNIRLLLFLWPSAMNCPETF